MGPVGLKQTAPGKLPPSPGGPVALQVGERQRGCLSRENTTSCGDGSERGVSAHPYSPDHLSSSRGDPRVFPPHRWAPPPDHLAPETESRVQGPSQPHARPGPAACQACSLSLSPSLGGRGDGGPRTGQTPRDPRSRLPGHSGPPHPSLPCPSLPPPSQSGLHNAKGCLGPGP